MKYFSMFSGIGGFELGINRHFNFQKVRGRKENSQGSNEYGEGLHPIPSETTRDKNRQHNELYNRDIDEGQPYCVGFSEIDKYAIQIYQKHFKGHKNYGNCRKIKWDDVEDFDLLVGGFPCQAFSIAGKRGGFKDTRGTLFFEIARCLREKQPRLFLLENVKGLLSHDKGKTFFTILTTLDELGYDCQWQVLNSKNFGVPQNRERVFIVGHLRGTSRPKVFPIKEGNKKIAKSHKLQEQIASTLTTAEMKCGRGMNMIQKIQWDTSGKGYKSQQNRAYFSQGITGCLTNNIKSNVILDCIYDDVKIRRLTPTECERLQGFPDGWTKQGVYEKGNNLIIYNSQRYKCLGNAVTVNVIQFIIKKLNSNGAKNNV